MKRIISFILLLSTVLALSSCGADYEPVVSTDEESRVLMTFELEGEKYELKYELYRALFLNHSKEYDGGNKSFWATDAAADAKIKLDEKIVSLSLDIFAALHLCKKIGYDPYSIDAENKIKEYIKQSVDGDDVVGFNGDYDAYLSHLKELNINYSVQTLMYRYAIAYDKIVTYYRGTDDIDNPKPDMKDGALEYTENDVRAFYNSDASARISTVTFNAEYTNAETVRERRNKIASYATEAEALAYAAQFTNPLGDPEDIIRGTLVGKSSMDAAYYAEVTEAAFSLPEGKASDVITVTTDEGSEYWIVYKISKTAEYLEDNFDTVEDVYVAHRIGQIVAGAKDSLAKTLKYTGAYNTLDRSKISMN